MFATLRSQIFVGLLNRDFFCWLLILTCTEQAALLPEVERQTLDALETTWNSCRNWPKSGDFSYDHGIKLDNP